MPGVGDCDAGDESPTDAAMVMGVETTDGGDWCVMIGVDMGGPVYDGGVKVETGSIDSGGVGSDDPPDASGGVLWLIGVVVAGGVASSPPSGGTSGAKWENLRPPPSEEGLKKMELDRNVGWRGVMGCCCCCC